jgi:hypothetical protein
MRFIKTSGIAKVRSREELLPLSKPAELSSAVLKNLVHPYRLRARPEFIEGANRFRFEFMNKIPFTLSPPVLSSVAGSKHGIPY